MYATLLVTALAVGQPPTGNDRPAAQPGATPGASAADRLGAAGNVSLDGNWTVISLEKNGQPVPNAQNMTVTVRGNTVTFDAGKATGQQPGGAANNPNQMRAMRLDFGRDGRVYVTEANAEGKFDAAPGAAPGSTPRPGTGTDRPATDRPAAGDNDRPGGATREERQNATGAGSSFGTPGSGTGGVGTGAAARPGEPAIPAGSKAGVYVLTQDYFAVCIHEENRPGTSPGLDRPNPAPGADRPAGDRPAPGADRPATGGTLNGTTDRPGASGAGSSTTGGDRPAAGGAGTGLGAPATDRAGLAGGMMPQNRSYATVILKRAGGAGQPGGATPDRNK